MHTHTQAHTTHTYAHFTMQKREEAHKKKAEPIVESKIHRVAEESISTRNKHSHMYMYLYNLPPICVMYVYNV